MRLNRHTGNGHGGRASVRCWHSACLWEKVATRIGVHPPLFDTIIVPPLAHAGSYPYTLWGYCHALSGTWYNQSVERKGMDGMAGRLVYHGAARYSMMNCTMKNCKKKCLTKYIFVLAPWAIVRARLYHGFTQFFMLTKK